MSNPRHITKPDGTAWDKPDWVEPLRVAIYRKLGEVLDGHTLACLSCQTVIDSDYTPKLWVTWDFRGTKANLDESLSLTSRAIELDGMDCVATRLALRLINDAREQFDRLRETLK